MADSILTTASNESKPEVVFALDSAATDHFVKDYWIVNKTQEMQDSREIYVASTIIDNCQT